MKEFSYLNPESQDNGKELSNLLNIELDKFKSLTKNKIIILTDKPRKLLGNTLLNLGCIHDPNISGSSMGGFIFKESKILIKPIGINNKPLSSGIENELCFIDLINNHISDKPINIKFNNHIIHGVSKCIDASRNDSRSYYKSDAQLLDVNNNVLCNISLKKRNAIRWESSKSREINGENIFKILIERLKNNKYPNLILKEISNNQDKFYLFSKNDDIKLSRVIITGFPTYLLEETIFGNDNPKTIVIKEDFELFNNYKFEDNMLDITCFKLYTKIEDIINTDDEPVMALSHHINQKYGIEFRSFSKKLFYDKNGDISKTVRNIEWND